MRMWCACKWCLFTRACVWRTLTGRDYMCMEQWWRIHIRFARMNSTYNYVCYTAVITRVKCTRWSIARQRSRTPPKKITSGAQIKQWGDSGGRPRIFEVLPFSCVKCRTAMMLYSPHLLIWGLPFCFPQKKSIILAVMKSIPYADHIEGEHEGVRYFIQFIIFAVLLRSF